VVWLGREGWAIQKTAYGTVRYAIPGVASMILPHGGSVLGAGIVHTVSTIRPLHCECTVPASNGHDESRLTACSIITPTDAFLVIYPSS
jgi:hypothetical protein